MITDRVLIAFLAGFLVSVVITLAAFALTAIYFSVTHTSNPSEVIATTSPPPCRTRIFAYYYGSVPVSETQLKKLTHVTYQRSVIHPNGSLKLTDGDHQNFMDLKHNVGKLNHKVNLLISASFDDDRVLMSDIAANQTRRRMLVKSITSLIQEHRIDGVHSRWYWPVSERDIKNHRLICQELRESLTELAKDLKRNDPYVISISLPCAFRHIFLEILPYVDFVNIDTEDFYGNFHGSNPELTGPPGPLYSGHKWLPVKNVDLTLKKYVCETKMPEKLNMQVEFRGRLWKNVKNDNSSKMWKVAEPVNGKIEGGVTLWRHMEYSGWDVEKASWDDASKSSYIWDPEERTLLAFESERSLKEKMKYAEEKNIGGISIFMIDDDDDADTLFNIVSSVRLCGTNDDEPIKYNCR